MGVIAAMFVDLAKEFSESSNTKLATDALKFESAYLVLLCSGSGLLLTGKHRRGS